MKKAILVLAILVSGNTFATGGLFTRVSSYTLTVTQGVKNGNTANPIPVNFSVEGFATKADCDAEGESYKTQPFPQLPGGSYGAVVSYANFKCHKVHELIPVLDVVLPTAP